MTTQSFERYYREDFFVAANAISERFGKDQIKFLS